MAGHYRLKFRNLEDTKKNIEDHEGSLYK